MNRWTRRGLIAGGLAGAASVTRLLAQQRDALKSVAGIGPLDFATLTPTFSTDFADPGKPVFRVNGGPFSTRFERFSGARTLPPNKELELYVDSRFVPSPDGTSASGQNDAPLGSAPPAGLDPFRLEGGTLVITASPTPPALLRSVGRPYVSGMISTDLSFSQRYGYFEMRAQLPGGRGLWPAFWLFGTTQAYRLEIDILEALGHETNRIYQSAQPNSARGDGHHLPLRVPFDYTAAMHSYGALWTPDALTFYVDGRATASIDGAPFRDEVPVYMMANLAVGGNWGGNPDSSTRFPAEMRIAHIKAYQLR